MGRGGECVAEKILDISCPLIERLGREGDLGNPGENFGHFVFSYRRFGKPRGKSGL